MTMPAKRISVRRVFVAIAILLSAAILAVWAMNGTRTPEADSAERSDPDEVVVPLTDAEAVEIAERETADLFYDRNAAPAVEFGSSVCKVTFWFPPDPGLPGKTFAAATVWIDVETKAVVQVEVVED